VAPQNPTQRLKKLEIHSQTRQWVEKSPKSRRRGNIDKARELNSNRKEPLFTKNPGQVQHCGRDQTPDFPGESDNTRATTACRKRVNKTVTKLSVINCTTLVSVLLFFW